MLALRNQTCVNEIMKVSPSYISGMRREVVPNTQNAAHTEYKVMNIRF